MNEALEGLGYDLILNLRANFSMLCITLKRLVASYTSHAGTYGLKTSVPYSLSFLYALRQKEQLEENLVTHTYLSASGHVHAALSPAAKD